MRTVLNVNKDWHFYKDTRDTALIDGGESISLPHTWNAIDGQDGGNDYFRGSWVYKKTVCADTLPAAEKYYLEICGANSSADVYVGATHLAHHDGGYSTFRVDITDYVSDAFDIAVVVDNAPNEEIYPQTADFTFYGGLYRDVNIITVQSTHFDLSYYGGNGLMITPKLSDTDAIIEINAYIENKQEGDLLRFTVLNAEGESVAEKTVSESKAEIVLESVHLWDGVKDPYLYTLSAEILRNGECVDVVSDRFGVRSFRIDPDRGFILNGREYPLRGVARHQDRWMKGNALSPEDHREDMDLICEMGANTIRLAHYQHDRYFYDLCDERGIVVWAEIPYISRHMSDGNDNTVSQMKELVTQNYNHPSIVVWGLSNEITMDGARDPDMIRQHEILNDLCHEMDKTRLTTIACISMCSMDEKYVHISDVVSYNHYFGWYGGDVKDNGVWFDNFHKKYPNTPIGCSEYGCEALNWHTSDPKQGDYTEEYQAYYHEELIKQFFSRQYIWATHVWNMFDFGADARAEGGENGQNHKGLVTIDRKYKKDAFYAYKAWLSDEPFVHLCGKRYVDRVEDVTRITVYSNLPEVELFLNGESLGKKTAPDHFFYFDVPNVGESVLVAKAGDLLDEGHIRKVNEMNPDYVLREVGAVLNWFDITEVEGRFSLNDTLGEIKTTLRGKLWLLGLFIALAKKQMGPQKKGEKNKKKKTKSKKGAGGGMADAMNMISSFTVLRFTGMLGIRNISFSKEELLRMNKKLNRIKKPKSPKKS